MTPPTGSTSSGPLSRRATDPPGRFAMYGLAGACLEALCHLVGVAEDRSLDDDAVCRAADAAAIACQNLGDGIGGRVVFRFGDGVVFVDGQLLRAGRAEYEAAGELAQRLERHGASELGIDPQVTREELIRFANALERGAATTGEPPPGTTTLRTISLNKVEPRAAVPPPEDEVLLAYGAALAVMRHYYRRVSEAAAAQPHRVKRVSQRLVSLSANRHAALALTTFATSHRDAAGFAVLTALSAVLVARRVTEDRVVLARLAFAALLCDVGRVSRSGSAKRDHFVGLDREGPPAAGARWVIESGGRTEATLARAAIVDCVEQLESSDAAERTVPADDAVFAARILLAARTFVGAIAPASGAPGVSPADALAVVSAAPDTDDVVARLMVEAFGVLPTGTVVELETGEWAVVAGPSRMGTAPDRPCVSVVTSSEGDALPCGSEMDLGGPQASFPAIARVIPPAVARFNTTSALFAEGVPADG